MPGSTGLLFGHFDLLHVGDLDVIRQAKSRCDRLVGAVISDELVESASGAAPIVTLSERAEILRHVRLIDDVVTVGDAAQLHELLSSNDTAIFVTPSLGALLAGLDAASAVIVALEVGRDTASELLRAALERRAAVPGSQAASVA
jgi:cytidyltransferase-like protein